jgi:hypothetical protein
MGLKNLWVDYWLSLYYNKETPPQDHRERPKKKVIVNIEPVKEKEHDLTSKRYFYTEVEK